MFLFPLNSIKFPSKPNNGWRWKVHFCTFKNLRAAALKIQINTSLTEHWSSVEYHLIWIHIFEPSSRFKKVIRNSLDIFISQLRLFVKVENIFFKLPNIWNNFSYFGNLIVISSEDFHSKILQNKKFSCILYWDNNK